MRSFIKRQCEIFAVSFLLLAVVSSFHSDAQNVDTSIFVFPIRMDSFVVKSGFDVSAFIRRVQTDTTFYKAFKSMRFVPYHSENDILVYDKGNTIVASQHSKTQQKISNACRTTVMLEEKSTGDYYKPNGDFNYYTARLFAHLFFSKEPVCNESDIVSHALDKRPSGQMAKSEYELKQLIFNPGSKVAGIPFMGNKAAIFEPGESEKYDFKVTMETYEGQQCYVFRITPKEGYEHKVLYNELTTWFRKNDYSIVARDYSLSYSTMVYDFNVIMKVRTKQIGNKLYPTSISYNGNWHVFTKKRERVKFKIDINY
jgi:hypothetical protein